MSFTYATFTGVFPEFSSTIRWPQASVEFWIAQSLEWVSDYRFPAGKIDLARMLWVAHNITLNELNAAETATGGEPGGLTAGAVTSKSVDKVSVGYGTGSDEVGAGEWNLTTYGKRLYRMLKTLGSFMYVPGPCRSPSFGRIL